MNAAFVRCQSTRQAIRWKAQYGPELFLLNVLPVLSSGRIAVRAGLATQLAEQHRTAAREDRKEILLLAWGAGARPALALIQLQKLNLAAAVNLSTRSLELVERLAASFD